MDVGIQVGVSEDAITAYAGAIVRIFSAGQEYGIDQSTILAAVTTMEKVTSVNNANISGNKIGDGLEPG